MSHAGDFGGLDAQRPPEPPYNIGDFGSWNAAATKYRLDWCPLCEILPGRSSTALSPRHSPGINRAEHFFVEHREDLLAILDRGKPPGEEPVALGGDRDQTGLDAFAGGGR